MNNRPLWLVALLALSTGFGACAPRTKKEKIQDKVEDAGHEIRQGAKRAADRVDDATK